MGVATALNFQPTGNCKAAITGDFVLLGSEVNPVIKALTTKRNCSDGASQPHAHGRTPPVLHALLGKR
jgi:hypothetical protein